jgi:hypothetical protein
MKEKDRLGKTIYCAIKSNRLETRVDQKNSYCSAQNLPLTLEEEKQREIRRFPAMQQLRLIRIQESIHRTEYVETNDLKQMNKLAVQKENGLRSKIEQLHREIKQTTGIEIRKNGSIHTGKQKYQ